MFNRVLLILLFTGASFLTGYSQNPSKYITNISFRFNHSRRIAYSNITIDIIKRQNEIYVKVNSKAANDNPQWSYSNFNKAFNINQEVFDNLAEEVSLLLKMNMILPFAIGGGVDGTMCEIEFGSYANTVTYSFWTPDSGTDHRGLSTFLDACKKLLRIGGFNPDEIL